MNWNKYNDSALEGCAAGIMKMLAITILLTSIISSLSSCKHIEYVTVPEVHTDTLYISKTQHDSIYVKDSIYVHEWTKGDTVYVELTKTKTKTKIKLCTDTVRELRVDSVAVPYEVIKTKTNYSGWFAFFALLIVGAGAWFIWRKFGK